MNSLSRFCTLFILCVVFASAATHARDTDSQRLAPAHNERMLCKQTRATLFARTELFFGLSRTGGPDVSEAEFQIFVDTKVTPRFPDGLTLLSGKGQFRSAAGSIVQEGSKLLILLYPFSAQSSEVIELIRNDYKVMFQQESVLRVDEPTCVSF